MDRATRIHGHDPLTVIELITAVFLVIGGIYVASPILDVTVLLSEAPRAIQALGSTAGLLTLGLSCITIGLVHIWSIMRYKYKVRAAMVFTHIMVRLYTILAVITAQGIFPLDWLNSFILVCILSVCYLVNKRKIRFFREVRE